MEARWNGTGFAHEARWNGTGFAHEARWNGTGFAAFRGCGGTTVLSSAGAQCSHLRYVAAQLSHASVVVVACLVGYVAAGFTGATWVSLSLGIVLMIADILVLKKSKHGTVEA